MALRLSVDEDVERGQFTTYPRVLRAIHLAIGCAGCKNLYDICPLRACMTPTLTVTVSNILSVTRQ